VILKRISVRRFRALEELDVDFSPGLNVVRGPNEAGKSTLQAAIVAALFADPGSRSRATEAMRPWDGGDLPTITAELATPAVHYTVTKDFQARQAELIGPDRVRVGDRAVVMEHMAAFTGLSDEAVYRATGCLVQQQWAQVSAGAQLQDLLQQSLTGGAEGLAVGQIIAGLNRSVAEMERGTKRDAPRNPGALAATIHLRRQAEVDLAAARADYEATVAAQADLGTAQGELAQAQRDVDQLSTLKQRAQRYIRIDQEVGELKHAADRLGARIARLQRLEAEIAALQKGLDEAPAVDGALAHQVAEQAQQRDRLAFELQDLRRRALLVDNECKQLDAALRARGGMGPDEVRFAVDTRRQANEAAERARRHAEEADTHVRAIEEGTRRLAPRRWLLAVGAITLILGAAATVFSLWGLTGCGLGGALLLVATLRRPPEGWEQLPRRLEASRCAAIDAEDVAKERTLQLRRQLTRALGEEPVDLDEGIARLAALVAAGAQDVAQAKATLEVRREALSDLREQIGRTERAEHELVRSLSKTLAQTGLAGVEELLERAEARDAAIQELRDRRSQQSGALDGETIEALEQTQRGLLLDVRAREYEMESDELTTARLSPQQYQQLIAQIEEAQGRREAQDDLVRQAQLRVAASVFDADAVNALEGRLESLLEREAALAERLAVHKLAREVMLQAQQETFAEAGVILEPHMRRVLRLLTGQRYADVRLSPEMRPIVSAPGHGHDLEVADSPTAPSLSCATAEQVFLAARFALIEVLWPDGGPPVLMDDPLVNFDQSRREAALEAIRGLATAHQVILFTCSHEYDRWADTIIDLPGPAAAASAAGD